MTPELRERIRRTRRVATPWRDDSTRGTDGAHLDGLLEHWANAYDWDVHERRIRAFPWVTAGAGDTELRMIHQRSADPGAPVVVLLHGWPDSVLRFERVLPLLADVHVVVPALPGFPFAAPLTAPGMSVNRIVRVVADALDELGYSRYTLSGGDVGGAVAEVLAGEHPDRVASLHLTNVAPQHAFAVDPARLAPDAAAYLARAAQWFRTDGGYIAEQSTRPNTLAVALGDSPAGLAAWLVEKLESWSGESAFTPDELLTWVTAYWVTGTIGTSFATYTEPAALPARIETPTVLSVFAHDTKPEPRSYAEVFLNVREYVAHPAGGHFAAWEQPEAYAADVHRAVELGTQS
ncbi:pimeloyl-ACP methyl ester carboxylesterase [Amycolatopsis bartoniae]|uniref:Microsomal epoxide hydrolase n=1 Tax=Amycolatopsis bartoniae TaxID=941986 RepID=A0A8H9J180_9PSEU|nr:epoxide hydrolase family protein [Amycolatopsis bartoniae]MBB2938855.1 pimeloyl-ACP methyl ester carboxylesterase [Amycolatopsis bartoniae]TVT00695.1 epoxide hydrolase [Amycolatopsis bartoniae]GHF77118.1 microsomal epoxide hydrolase [Amycolatopsis bartoniae]